MKNPLAIEEYVDLLLDLHTTPRDRALLEFVLLPSPTQAELDACLDICDIEVLGAAKALLLSYVMEAHPELKFSDYAGPRLKGLINFFRFHNLKLLTHFSKIGKALNRAGIPMLIFKGGAMKFLRPAVMRPMGDVDIMIPRDRIEEAGEICRELGYLYPLNPALYAIDIKTHTGEGVIDIHYQILAKNMGKEALLQGILARASEQSAFGVNILLPSPEDLLFICLSNLAKDLKRATKIHSMLLSVLDCQFLTRSKKDFDWSILIQNARITGTMHHLELTSRLLGKLAPGLVPTLYIPFSRDMQIYCERACHNLNYFTAGRKTAVLRAPDSPFKRTAHGNERGGNRCSNRESGVYAL